jgi:4-hydroxybenzoate polyprenyltransferase
VASGRLIDARTDESGGVIARWLIWSNILIAGSAAGWMLVTLRTLSMPLDLALVALAFVLALVFYTRDRLDASGRASDRMAMPERTDWVQRHTPAFKAIMWIGAIGALGLLALRSKAMPPLLIGLGFALTYTLRWLPWRGRRVGWKHLPGMKMPFVATLWTLVVVVMPAAVYGMIGQGATWLLAAAVCALIMVQILLNDLRDIEADRAAGTFSLPVLIGDRNARRVGLMLVIAGALIPVSLFPFPFLLSGLYSAILLWRYRREHDTQWRGWIEGQGWVAGLAALVSTGAR